MSTESHAETWSSSAPRERLLTFLPLLRPCNSQLTTLAPGLCVAFRAAPDSLQDLRIHSSTASSEASALSSSAAPPSRWNFKGRAAHVPAPSAVECCWRPCLTILVKHIFKRSMTSLLGYLAIFTVKGRHEAVEEPHLVSLVGTTAG